MANENKDKVDFGDEVKDRITGFKGIVVCITRWFNGCIRVGVQSDKVDKDGKPGSHETFDIEQLEVTKAKKCPPVMRPTGGPMPDAKQRASARRR